MTAIVKPAECPFEEYAQKNGEVYWTARWLMTRLGYQTWPSFHGVIHKALGSCMQLGLPPLENFRQFTNTTGQDDYKLSRFACFLIATYADDHKPEVVQVKTYLAALAALLTDPNSDLLERIKKRSELSVGERMMSSAAGRAGVEGAEMAIFKDAGYRGMYNMSLQALCDYKGMPEFGKTLYDFMGITELAANSFRVTQTAERLKHTGARGLAQASHIAKEVGKEVRATMKRSSGVLPEELPIDHDINTVKRELKTASRALAKRDGKKRSRKKNP